MSANKSPKTPPAALESRASFLLSQLGAQCAQKFGASLSRHGLNPNQFGLLVHLSRAEGQSQRQLAETLGIHRNTMVSLIDDLERRDLVERHQHPHDRRAYAIHLTTKAREILPKATRIADQQESVLLESFTDDERQTLMDLLTRLSLLTGQRTGVHPGYQSTADTRTSHSEGH